MAKTAVFSPQALTAPPKFRHSIWWYLKWFFLVLSAITICLLGAGFAAGKGLYDKLEKVTPDLQKLLEKNRAEPSRVYAADGTLLAEFKTQERHWIPLDDLKVWRTRGGKLVQEPGRLIDATLSIEDTRFYTHPGIDIKRLLGALRANYRAGDTVQGGSTITEQLVKNVYLTQSRTFERRLNATLISLQLERKLSKDEILEAYLNEIFYGNRSYGAEAAAQTYFNKHAKDLTIAEAALLAGLPQNPAGHNPFRHYDDAKERQRVVLHEMFQNGRINYTQYKEALADEGVERAIAASKIRVRRERRELPRWKSPYFVSYVQSYLKKQGGFDLNQPGLKVYTSLDPKLQRIGEAQLLANLRLHGRKIQGALVSIDPWTGQVVAMVGGRDYYDKTMNGEFNRAVLGKRQPGSTMKPYIYATAMEAGMTPDSVLVDSPLWVCGTGECGPGHRSERRGGHLVRNYDRTHHGALALRSALAMSNNVIATKVLLKVGIQNVVQKAHLMGIGSSLAPYPSLALGTSDLSLLEHVSAYGVFATKGLRAEATPVLRVENYTGEVLMEQPTPVRAARVMSQNAANAMYSMLRYVVTNGTGRPVQIPGVELIGKTGTTSSNKDVWFMGASPQLVCGVWMGYDRPQPLAHGSAGGKWCGPVFREFMRTALPIWKARHPLEKLVEDARATAQRRFLAQQFKQYIRVRICNESGQLATRDCPDTHFDTFSAAGGAPTEFCQIHRRNPTQPRALDEDALPIQPGDLGAAPDATDPDALDNSAGIAPDVSPAPDPNTQARREYQRDAQSDGNPSVPAYEGDGVVPLDDNAKAPPTGNNGRNQTRPRDRGAVDNGNTGQVLDENGVPQTLDNFDDANPPARRENGSY